MSVWRYVFSSIVLSALVLSVDTAAAQDQSRFVLTGVVTKEDGSSVAWLGEPTITKDRPLLVREGDQVGPYRVTKIQEDRVELEGPAGALVVRLYGTAPMGSGMPAPSPSPLASQPRLPAAAPSPIPIPQIDPKDARAYLDANSDPRLRKSPGFQRMLGN